MENSDSIESLRKELINSFKDTHWWIFSNPLHNTGKLANKMSEFLVMNSDILLSDDQDAKIILDESSISAFELRNNVGNKLQRDSCESESNSTDNNGTDDESIKNATSENKLGSLNVFSDESFNRNSDFTAYGEFTLELLFSMTSLKYYCRIIQVLKSSFSHALLFDKRMLNFMCVSMIDITLHITRVINAYSNLEKSICRDSFNLESVPFNFARKCAFPIQNLRKDDERKLAMQSVFLLILRKYIPLKYKNNEQFLEVYPNLLDRSGVEINKLRICANWFDLVFYTLPSKNNKTFLMNLIPRICEGNTVKYITGSGETIQTSDRVNIFRTEGNCEKVNRPPRKRKEESIYCNSDNLSDNAVQRNNNIYGSTDFSSTSLSPTGNILYYPIVYSNQVPGFYGNDNFEIMKKPRRDTSILPLFNVPGYYTYANPFNNNVFVNTSTTQYIPIYSSIIGNGFRSGYPNVPNIIVNNPVDYPISTIDPILTTSTRSATKAESEALDVLGNICCDLLK